jgi:hypothetical protein
MKRIILALLLASSTTLAAQQGKAMAALSQDPACSTTKIAAAGGPMPRGQNTIVMRYLQSREFFVGK